MTPSTFALATAFLLSAPAGASLSRDPSFDFFGRAPAPAPERLAEVAVEAADWRGRKAAAHRMMARIPAEARRDGWREDETRSILRKLQVFMLQLEDITMRVDSYARADLAAQPAGPLRLTREAAVEEVARTSLLAIYGSLFPAIMEEAFEDTPGEPLAGRRYAGPEWRLVLPWDEAMSVVEHHMGLSGFDRARWRAYGARARTELGLPERLELKLP